MRRPAWITSICLRMRNFPGMIVLALLISGFTWGGQADRSPGRRHQRSRYAGEAGQEDEGVMQTPSPPQWVDKLDMKTVIAEPLHKRVILSCKAVGYPQPDIKWTKDGIKIEDDNLQKQDAFNYYKVTLNKIQKMLFFYLFPSFFFCNLSLSLWLDLIRKTLTQNVVPTVRNET